jgi:hypothetical protein
MHSAGSHWDDRCPTGGSAVTYYAPAAYQSRDADFVLVSVADKIAAGAALHALGYRQVRGTYQHDESSFTVEFPPGPLAVGQDLLKTYDTVHRHGELLHVIRRAHSVRDRLASFYFFADRSALDAAVAVALSGSVDLSKIEAWSSAEGERSGYEEFRLRFVSEGKR